MYVINSDADKVNKRLLNLKNVTLHFAYIENLSTFVLG